MPHPSVTSKYVGFCDVLGFSAAVLADFDATVALYEELRATLQNWPFPEKAHVSVYSDSILVVSDELPAVINAIVSLNWAALMRGWLVRGGIAHGRHWETKDNGNLFVVSEALVKAVAIEKSVKVPAVVVSSEVQLGVEAWVPRFEHGAFSAPLLYFDGRSGVNPFNDYWFASAVLQAKAKRDSHPQHAAKYEWFLSLAESVARDDLLVPDSAMSRMLELGLLRETPKGAA